MWTTLVNVILSLYAKITSSTLKWQFVSIIAAISHANLFNFWLSICGFNWDSFPEQSSCLSDSVSGKTVDTGGESVRVVIYRAPLPLIVLQPSFGPQPSLTHCVFGSRLLACVSDNNDSWFSEWKTQTSSPRGTNLSFPHIKLLCNHFRIFLRQRHMQSKQASTQLLTQ